MTSPVPHFDDGLDDRSEAGHGETETTSRIRWSGLAGYLLLVAGGIGLFFLIRAYGVGLSAPALPADAQPIGRSPSGQFDVVSHVIATLAAVVFLGFVLGRGLRYLGQPPVIGEVIAGIMLGPSLLGAIWPDAMHF